MGWRRLPIGDDDRQCPLTSVSTAGAECRLPSSRRGWAKDPRAGYGYLLALRGVQTVAHNPSVAGSSAARPTSKAIFPFTAANSSFTRAVRNIEHCRIQRLNGEECEQSRGLLVMSCKFVLGLDHPARGWRGGPPHYIAPVDIDYCSKAVRQIDDFLVQVVH